jgi:hypothetical protein
VRTALIDGTDQTVFIKDLAPWEEIYSSNTFQCTVTIVFLEDAPAHAMPTSVERVLVRTLRQLVDGEDVMDTKFILFSRHHIQTGADGQPSLVGASTPRAVFASAAALSSFSEYFQNRTSAHYMRQVG